MAKYSELDKEVIQQLISGILRNGDTFIDVLLFFNDSFQPSRCKSSRYKKRILHVVTNYEPSIIRVKQSKKGHLVTIGSILISSSINGVQIECDASLYGKFGLMDISNVTYEEW